MWPVPTVTRGEVPKLFHEPNVYTGFRPCNQSWTAYLLSLFQWHNEVINVWTHIIGFVMVMIYHHFLAQEFSLFSDPYMWPLTVGIMTMYVMYLASSGAHLFQNKDELAHYTCFMCDYMGIGLYGFGSTMIHYWYCLHEDFLGSTSHMLAIPVGAVLAVVVCTCCSIAKTRYRRPYPFVRRLWQMFSVLAIYIWINLPIWYRLYLYLHDGRWEPSFSNHMQQMTWFTVGGVFFGSDIPQRYLPGRFDLIGHSHQLFHMCIVMTTYEQLNAAYLEITDNFNSVHRMSQPTFLETWGMLALVMVANSTVVYIFHRKCHCQLELEKLRKKKDDLTEGEAESLKEGCCCEELANGTLKSTNNSSSGMDLRSRNGMMEKSLQRQGLWEVENTPVTEHSKAKDTHIKNGAVKKTSES